MKLQESKSSNLENKSQAIKSVLSKTYSFIKDVDVRLGRSTTALQHYEVTIFCDYDFLKKESGNKDHHLFQYGGVTLGRMALSGIITLDQEENIRRIVMNVSKMVPPTIQSATIHLKNATN